ncbi:hypothetical protein HT031_002952 [Scenedesmus sp. PABB004]|nr:hypothetical protein HT031_002952 [Scenedesmus sp. PABB004]
MAAPAPRRTRWREAAVADLSAEQRAAAARAGHFNRLAANAGTPGQQQRVERAAAEAAAAAATAQAEAEAAAAAAAACAAAEADGSQLSAQVRRLVTGLRQRRAQAESAATAAAAAQTAREASPAVRKDGRGAAAASKAAVKHLLRNAFFARHSAEQLRSLWSHPEVVRRRDALGPQYQAPAEGKACCSVWCGRCNVQLPSQHHLALHVCARPVHVDAPLLEALASAAGCAATIEGGGSGSRRIQRCFLCGAALCGGALAHDCTALLWRVLLVDQSQLPWASPEESPAVVLQQAHLTRLRQECHVPVAAVFMCPPRLLPTRLASEARRAEMLRRRTWPLLSSSLLLGPSSYVPGEQGLFMLDAPDHFHTEHRTPAWPAALLGFEARARAGERQRPVRTRTMAGFYTGQRRAGLRAGQSEPSLAAIEVEGAVVDPGHVGGVMQMANLAHGPAALLETDHVRWLPRDAPQALLCVREAARRSPGRPGWAIDLSGQEFKLGAAMDELAWDYAAVTDDADDELAATACVCWACEQRRTRKTVLTVRREGGRQQARQQPSSKRRKL